MLITEAQFQRLNLCLEYFYRDAGNNKTPYLQLVFNYPLNAREVKDLWETLDGKEFFIPEQVGLPDAFTDFIEKGYDLDTEEDHVFNTMTNIFLTVAPANQDITGIEILERFRDVEEEGGWDIISAMRHKGLI